MMNGTGTDLPMLAGAALLGKSCSAMRLLLGVLSIGVGDEITFAAPMLLCGGMRSSGAPGISHGTQLIIIQGNAATGDEHTHTHTHTHTGDEDI